MKTLKIFASLMGFLLTSPTFAQHGSGNSGEVVMKNGKYYLLDVVEGGLENMTVERFKEHFSSQGGVPSDYIAGGWVLHYWAKPINRLGPEDKKVLSPETLDFLYFRLCHLEPFQAMSLIAAIKSFNWVFDDSRLKKQKDTVSNIDVTPKNNPQLAIRRGQTIQIDLSIWQNLDTFNQVATLLHEVISASLSPLTRPDGTQFQDSHKAIEIVGQIMNPEMKIYDLSIFTVFDQPVLDFARAVQPVQELRGHRPFGLTTYSGNSEALSVETDPRVDVWQIIDGQRKNRKKVYLSMTDESPLKPILYGQDTIIGEICVQAKKSGATRLEIENRWSSVVYALKDYIDADQTYKKYFTVQKIKDMHHASSQEGSVLDKGSFIYELKDRSLKDCESDVRALVERAAIPLVKHLPLMWNEWKHRKYLH